MLSEEWRVFIRINWLVRSVMKDKFFLLSGFLLAVILLGACTEEPSPATEAQPGEISETPTPPPTATLPVDLVSMEDVANIEWQLSSVHEINPIAEIEIPDPVRYTLTFWRDGTFTFQADCSSGTGVTTVSQSSMQLEIGPMTLMECAPGSFSSDYLSWLGNVDRFGVREGTLVLGFKDAGGEMRFLNGGAPSPTPIPTPEPPSCNAGIDPETVSIDTFDLPEGYQVSCVPGTPYDDSQSPGPVGLPDHIEVRFEIGTRDAAPSVEPIIYIIPVESYEEMWEAVGDEGVTSNIEALDELLDSPPDYLPNSGIPILPYEEVRGVSDIQVQGKVLETPMGSGIRIVTRFSQGSSALTRDDPPLFYTFQGLSADGVYLITFFYPVTTNALPSSGEVSGDEIAELLSNPEAYLDEKAEELNQLAAPDWQPDLRVLDGLINSLEYGPSEDEVAALETPPPPAGVVLTDDFSVNRGWYTGESEFAEFNFEDGTYQITNKVLFSNIWSVRSLNRGDVGQQVDLQQVDGVGNGYYGVMCRFGDEGRNYYALTIGPEGFFGIGIMEEGSFRFLRKGVDEEDVIDGKVNGVNTVRGDCVGDTLTLYVNDRKLIEVEDDTIASGEVGLINGTGGQLDQVIRYDNYLVLEP